MQFLLRPTTLNRMRLQLRAAQAEAAQVSAMAKQAPLNEQQTMQQQVPAAPGAQELRLQVRLQPRLVSGHWCRAASSPTLPCSCCGASTAEATHALAALAGRQAGR